MLITSGTWRCSQTCAIASVQPESNAPTMQCAPSLITFSAWVRDTSGLELDVDVDQLDAIAEIGEHLAGAISAPRWQLCPACAR